MNSVVDLEVALKKLHQLQQEDDKLHNILDKQMVLPDFVGM